MLKKYTPFLGLIGTFLLVFLYLRKPSFPTPDKLLILLIFIGMIFRQTVEVLKRFVPFVVLLLAYDTFRGFADYLNDNVHYKLMADFDREFFAGLPTQHLQNWLWHGAVQWYDIGFYLIYMMHFVLPIALAILIWKTREKQYWRYVMAFVLVSFAGFFTYVLYPAAPPWLATQVGVIEPIHRISSDVWFTLGVNDFPSVYNKISPNPVAAVPSLHAAYATLFFLFMISLYKTRWKFLAAIYPFGIFVGTVYMGEHYVFDIILGVIYASIAYKFAPKALNLAIKIPKTKPAKKLLKLYKLTTK